MQHLFMRRITACIPPYQRTTRLFSSPYNYYGRVFKENLRLNNIYLIQKCSFGFKNKPPKNSRALKTRQAAAKRFTKTGSGKLKYRHANKRHLNGKKSGDQLRRLNQTVIDSLICIIVNIRNIDWCVAEKDEQVDPLMNILGEFISNIKFFQQPQIKIQAHVATYMGMFAVSTSFAYLVSYSYGKSEEEKLRELVDKEKYPERIQKNVEHRQHLQQFFDDLKDESKKDSINKKLDDILRGGKQEIKRPHNKSINTPTVTDSHASSPQTPIDDSKADNKKP